MRRVSVTLGDRAAKLPRSAKMKLGGEVDDVSFSPSTSRRWLQLWSTEASGVFGGSVADNGLHLMFKKSRIDVRTIQYRVLTLISCPT